MEAHVIQACTEYAKVLCTLRQEPDRAPELQKVARILLEMAPDEAHEYLDTIKKIMEIDTKVTDPTTVLLRASVLTEKRS
jgi:hypothetical protein